MVQIGINGFGRVGRMVLRACFSKNCKVVAINDPFITVDYMAYLFTYDSTHGKFRGTVETRDNLLIINSVSIQVTQEKNPKRIPWDQAGAEIIIETTGCFITKDKAAYHLDGGAKRVIIAAPSPDAPILVMGVNHECYDCDKSIISSSSPTTGCAAPLLKVLHDNYNVEEVLLTAIHSASCTQRTLDGPTVQPRREGRGALQNLVPAPTGAAGDIGRVLPELDGRVSGLAVRTPVANVSLLDLTVRLSTEASYDDIIKKIMEASDGYLGGILSYTTEDAVSSDFVGNSHSCIFDVKASVPLNKHFVKLLAWYDSETSYAHRILDLIEHISKTETRSL